MADERIVEVLFCAGCGEHPRFGTTHYVVPSILMEDGSPSVFCTKCYKSDHESLQQFAGKSCTLPVLAVLKDRQFSGIKVFAKKIESDPRKAVRRG